ncbi:MAG: RNA polymerase sigma factor [Sedimentisphaerales bacterium]|nr:RNA polymerase sigma factor [Sedimentisphaerales bacterium]
MDDNQRLNRIICDCKRGDHDGFSQIVELYAARLYGYFYRLSGNAETSNDLLSEVFLRLVEKIGTYSSGAFDMWLFKIAANIFYDHLRQQQRQKKLLSSHRQMLEDEMAEGRRSDDGAIDMLQGGLGRLDEQTRELIVLRYYSDLSFKEIAQMRGEPIGTVLSKVHRGLAKLRELMEQQYEKRN